MSAQIADLIAVLARLLLEIRLYLCALVRKAVRLLWRKLESGERGRR